jgi:hypothetical protein
MWRPQLLQDTTPRHVLNIVAAKDFDISVHLIVSSKFSYVQLPVLIYTITDKRSQFRMQTRPYMDQIYALSRKQHSRRIQRKSTDW